MAHFTKKKLTRQEWEGIEVPLLSNELEILSLIKKVGIIQILSLIKFHHFLSKSKITPSPEMHNHIYHHYFKDQCGGFKVDMMKRGAKKSGYDSPTIGYGGRSI